MKETIKIILWSAAAFLLVGGFIFGRQVFVYVKEIKGRQGSFTTFQGAKAQTNVQAVPTNAELVPANAPSIGDKNSPLTIVQFCDFECPFCRQEFPIVREFISSYSDQVRFVFRNFPNEDIHPHALQAAEAGACANDQGKFWEMHDKLFQNADHLENSDLLLYGAQIGLDQAKFRNCLENKVHEADVRKDFTDALSLGVQGTPTFFINGHKLEGVIPSDVLQRIVEIGVKK